MTKMSRLARFAAVSYICAAALPSSAQDSASDYLDEVIDYAKAVRANARQARQSARDFRIDYFKDGVADLSAFLQLLDDLQPGGVEVMAYALAAAAQDAAGANGNIDVSGLIAAASAIVGWVDEIVNETQVLATSVPAAQYRATRISLRHIRQDAGHQIDLAKDIIEEANALKLVPLTYDVRIELEDRWGNSVALEDTDLGGYYAYDHAHEVFLYPGYYSDPSVFRDLLPGTYTFGAYNGHFDGAGSQVVTLSDTLVGPDGFILVTLGYWSE